jgi:hypothetical protein
MRDDPFPPLAPTVRRATHTTPSRRKRAGSKKRRQPRLPSSRMFHVKHSFSFATLNVLRAPYVRSPVIVCSTMLLIMSEVSMPLT